MLGTSAHNSQTSSQPIWLATRHESWSTIRAVALGRTNIESPFGSYCLQACRDLSLLGIVLAGGLGAIRQNFSHGPNAVWGHGPRYVLVR